MTPEKFRVAMYLSQRLEDLRDLKEVLSYTPVKVSSPKGNIQLNGTMTDAMKQYVSDAVDFTQQEFDKL